MPSMIPVLIHDHDLPNTIRAELRAAAALPARASDGTAARRRAADALVSLYGLAGTEAAELVDLIDDNRQAA